MNKIADARWLNVSKTSSKLEQEIERLKKLGYHVWEEYGRWYACNENGGFEICCE